MKNKINKEEFFKQIALKAGIVDLKTVKDIYYALIKVMTSNIRGCHSIALPDWGEFKLTVYKSRNALNVNTRKIEILPPKPVIKFKSDTKLKRYFQSLTDL